MYIQNVIANLLNTIEGKEALLDVYRHAANESGGVQHQVAAIMRDVLDDNIRELNKILTDCMKVREADIIRNLEAKEKQ